MQNFTVVTDHKPLKGMWSKSLPDIANVRLQRYKEKLTGYNFKIEWREGKTNEIADALSRAPVFPPQEEEDASIKPADTCYAVSTLHTVLNLVIFLEAGRCQGSNLQHVEL